MVVFLTEIYLNRSDHLQDSKVNKSFKLYHVLERAGRIIYYSLLTEYTVSSQASRFKNSPSLDFLNALLAWTLIPSHGFHSLVAWEQRKELEGCSNALMILSSALGLAQLLGAAFEISCSLLIPSGVTANIYITWHFSNCFNCKFYRQVSLLDIGMKITNLLYKRTLNHDSGDSLPAQRMENERVTPWIRTDWDLSETSYWDN